LTAISFTATNQPPSLLLSHRESEVTIKINDENH
jgi:hypothetical protein